MVEVNDLLDSETWEPQTVCHETLRKSNSQNPVVLRFCETRFPGL